MKRAVLLVGHGSKLKGSSEALDQVIELLCKKEPTTFFQVAFLEIQSPNIPQGIELCLNQGAEEVIVVPYFVQTGRHVVEGIPRIVSETKLRFPRKNICLAEYLSFDKRIASIVLDRIQEARERVKAI